MSDRILLPPWRLFDADKGPVGWPIKEAAGFREPTKTNEYNQRPEALTRVT